MAKIIDLRSDTVTRPVPQMRRAIADAVVGDDVFGDDPTVNEFQDKVASLLGKEAAIFVPSGTMANQTALASLTSPGDEVILERQCHIFNYEVAAVAALSGLQVNPLDGDRGVITADQIEAAIRESNLHHPITRVISIENTHNRAGGRVYPLEEMRAIKALAGRRGLKVHLDGARLANAVMATGVPFTDYAACADTVSMCFSKGLGAPVGSIVASDAATIEIVRRKRKMFGGGMRQVGILAAAARYALDHHIERLKIDHENASELGRHVEAVDGLDLTFPVESNIVIFRVSPALGPVGRFLDALKSKGILAISFGTDFVRMVTHLDVDGEDIALVGEVMKSMNSS